MKVVLTWSIQISLTLMLFQMEFEILFLFLQCCCKSIITTRAVLFFELSQPNDAHKSLLSFIMTYIIKIKTDFKNN